MSFKTLCLAGATITLILSGVLMVHPPLLLSLFDLDGGTSIEVMTRRASVLLLGIAVTLWLARDAAPSPLRRAVAVGTAVTMLGLATLGTVEILRGSVGPGVILAIGTEIVLGAGFLWSTAEDRSASSRVATPRSRRV
ncbi:hypothetical protein [Rubrivirga sp.]|uniref:hypothetical protein n=1 Tax=Rubrivirga sp. TaxID=1885344 RepID=UPI003C771271